MIGVLDHPRIPRSRALAEEIAAWLTERGQTVWCGSNWDEAELQAAVGDLSLLVVLGGDGSILRAARIAAPAAVPVFTVNLGKLGFLSEAQPDEWADKLTSVLHGDYRLETRLMLQARVRRQGAPMAGSTALNEFVVGRGAQARVIRLGLLVDGDFVASFTADGLIVATPTGSTAYAMAAGGPILPPELQNFLVIPVAPHLSLDRAIVLRPSAQVRIIVSTDHDANLTVDGQDLVPLRHGDEIDVFRAEHDCRFVRVGDAGYFYRRLMKGLGLASLEDERRKRRREH